MHHTSIVAQAVDIKEHSSLRPERASSACTGALNFYRSGVFLPGYKYDLQPVGDIMVFDEGAGASGAGRIELTLGA